MLDECSDLQTTFMYRVLFETGISYLLLAFDKERQKYEIEEDKEEEEEEREKNRERQKEKERD